MERAVTAWVARHVARHLGMGIFVLGAGLTIGLGSMHAEWLPLTALASAYGLALWAEGRALGPPADARSG